MILTAVVSICIYIYISIRRNGGIPRAGRVRVREIKPFHVLLVQVKVEDGRVLLDPGAGDALRQRDEALLQTPPDEHLGPGLAVLLGNGPEGVVGGPLAPDERAPRLHGDVVVPGPAHDVGVRQPRVELPLSDGDLPAHARAGDKIPELVQVVDAVVGHAERANPPVVLGLDQRSPGALASQPAAIGRVDQEEIDVVKPRVGERLLDGFLGPLVAHLPRADLAGEEDVLPVQAGCADGVGAGCLILVHLCGIDVSVPALERVQHDGFANVHWRLVHAVSEDGHLVASGQLHFRIDGEMWCHCGGRSREIFRGLCGGDPMVIMA